MLLLTIIFSIICLLLVISNHFNLFGMTERQKLELQMLELKDPEMLRLKERRHRLEDKKEANQQDWNQKK
jgi:hypothetical protein